MRGHRHSNGLDAILDIEVKKLSALDMFVSLPLEGPEAGIMTTQYVVSKSSHVCAFCNGRFSLEDPLYLFQVSTKIQ